MEILESIVWVSIGFVSMFAAMELAWRQARRIESGEHIKGRLAITERNRNQGIYQQLRL
jgi:hypothetical protein